MTMRNRQNVPADRPGQSHSRESEKQGSDIANTSDVSVEDILKIDPPPGIERQIIADPNVRMMQGRLSNGNLAGGLQMHRVDVVERQDAFIVGSVDHQICFTFMFAGSLRFALAGQEYSLAADSGGELTCQTLAVTEPQTFTRYFKSDNPVNKLSLFVSHDWLRQRCATPTDGQMMQSFFECTPYVRHWKGDRKIRRTVQRLMALTHGQGRSCQLAMDTTATHLVRLMVEACTNQPTISDAQLEAPTRYIVGKLQREIERQLVQGVCDLDTISRTLGMSISTLQRRFKAETGTTVIEYLRRRRLELARSAMLCDDVSLTEAAFGAGYNHPSNFIAAFKRAFGVTPYAYVNTHDEQRV